MNILNAREVENITQFCAQEEEEIFSVQTKLENNLALSEIEHAHTLWPSNSTPR